MVNYTLFPFLGSLHTANHFHKLLSTVKHVSLYIYIHVHTQEKVQRASILPAVCAKKLDMHVHLDMYGSVCIRVCKCIHVSMFVYTNKPKHIHTYMCVYKRVYQDTAVYAS